MTDGTFLVSISGHLDYLEVFAESGSNWYCKYEFIIGPDWKIIGGMEAGLSQICTVNVNGEKIVLNLPVDVMLKSTSLYGSRRLDAGTSCKNNSVVQRNVEENTIIFPVTHGQQGNEMEPFEGPQVLLSVYREMTLEGYGRCYIPLNPGVHSIDISLTKPLTSTLLGQITSVFGYQPELLQPKMLTSTAGNNLLRMTSTGHLRGTLNVITQGFNRMGYDVGH